MLPHDLTNKVFFRREAQFVPCLYFNHQHPFQTRLGKTGDPPAFKVFAQDHAEKRGGGGVFPGGVSEVRARVLGVR
ncbi:MAG: hypothetical protein BWY65_01807 [Firmicutes bacterium ADurb.Bin373]|nr:MAG: hypothetical protein BWY65_01807 [Firmicutes bacterium ADurb.Bin373]